MPNLFRRLVGAAAISFAFLATSASAEEINVETYFGWLSVGTSYTVVEGHIFWVGEFSGTMTDNGAGSMFDNTAVQCPAWFDIDFNNNVATAGGYCINTTSAGDTYVMSWSCEGGPPFSGVPCHGESEVIAAAGGLAGMTGASTFDATTLLFHPNGNGSGFSTIVLDLDLP